MNIEYSSGIEKLISGINKITDAAAVTLGGAGNHVVIENPYGQGSQVTKDGVTVIRSISLEDPIENIGANFIKEVATKTLDEVGDGTTSSSIIAQDLIINAYKAVGEGYRTVDLKKGILKAKEDIFKHLETLSRKIENSNDTENIATISANNDKELGKLISDVFDISGIDGSITIEKSYNNQTTIEKSEGYYLETGLFNNNFATNKAKLISEYEKPMIIIYDKVINSYSEIRQTVELAINNKIALIIFCQDCKAEVSGYILNLIMQGYLACSIITIPGKGDNRRDIIQDLTHVTGARVFETENSLVSMVGDDIGSAEKIIITRTQTTIINGKGMPSISDYKELVEKQVESEETPFRKALAKERLSALNSNSVTLYIGGVSDTEISEKRDRIDDAICATRAALIDGYVPGGGTTLMFISQEAQTSEDKGYSLLMSAIQKPFKLILENAGEKPYKVEFGKGFNVITEQHENFFDKGIIDPTKVLKVCVDNAVSIATTVLSTKCIISSTK
jgi:chaperonin GroEL